MLSVGDTFGLLLFNLLLGEREGRLCPSCWDASGVVSLLLEGLERPLVFVGDLEGLFDITSSFSKTTGLTGKGIGIGLTSGLLGPKTFSTLCGTT